MKDPSAPGAGGRWLSPEERNARRAELVGWYGSGDARVRHHLPDAAFASARTLASRFLPVGEGPAATDRLGRKTRSWLLLDSRSRDELKVALSPVHPPFLWLGAGQSSASLSEALAPYFPAFLPSENKLGRTVRGLLGTSSPQPLDLLQLHARFTDSAFLEGLAWGSAYKKDPFLDGLPKGPEGRDMARRYREQAPVIPPSFSFRSLFSKSVLRAEAHPGLAQGLTLFVAQLRYRPAPHAPLLRELNQRLGTHYPEDLPVDLAGALLGLSFAPPEPILAALPEQTSPARISFGLLCLDALSPDDATAEARLRPYASHPEGGVRQLVANLALRRGLEALLSDMARDEPHPELKQRLAEAVQRLDS